MDPLSVTSGIVGIIAFAFQLAKTASKVKTAVEEIKSAPKEARDLIERLVMLETACQLVGFHLERRETLPIHPLPPSLDIISKALAQCLAKAQELEQMLLNLSSSNGTTRTARPKFDTVSRLRLVLRKDKISSLVQEIDRVVSLLQFVIQVDMWTMTSIPLQTPSLPSNGNGQVIQWPHLGGTTTVGRMDSAPSQFTVSRNVRRAQRQQRRTFRYLGYITWTVDDSWIGDENDNDNDTHIAHRKGRITFRLPFTSTQVRMHYDGGMGTPSCALNVTHIIDRSSELGRRLNSLMSPDADSKELHEMLSSRELSIYSIYRHNNEEFNLFFMAVAKRWAEGCRYLLQHDFRQKFGEDETPNVKFYTESDRSGKACEVTDLVLSARPYGMRGKDIEYLLESASEPEYFSQYVEVFLNSPAIDHTKVLSLAWRKVVVNMFRSNYPKWRWIQALRFLIDHGVDIHQPVYGFASAYARILDIQDHPFEADEEAYSWLETLKSCGVDLTSYLAVETPLIKEVESGQWLLFNRRKTVILDFHGLPMLSWRWESPTESSIIEVLEEFLNTGPEFVDCTQYGVHPAGPDDVRCWKAENYYSGSDQVAFPFRVSPLDLFEIDHVDDYIDSKSDLLWRRETYNRAIKIRDKRFARRQAKKWRKAHPGEKPPSNKMPGAWVD